MYRVLPVTGRGGGGWDEGGGGVWGRGVEGGGRGKAKYSVKTLNNPRFPNWVFLT